jgi:hypothetical protein
MEELRKTTRKSSDRTAKCPGRDSHWAPPEQKPEALLNLLLWLLWLLPLLWTMALPRFLYEAYCYQPLTEMSARNLPGGK